MSDSFPPALAGLRTLALVGAAASGKTSLLEALLQQAGAIGVQGSLERGTTVSDFDPLERRAQHSLNSALVHFLHQDTRIQVIDTPGAPRFSGSVAAGAGGGRDRRAGDQRRQWY